LLLKNISYLVSEFEDFIVAPNFKVSVGLLGVLLELASDSVCFTLSVIFENELLDAWLFLFTLPNNLFVWSDRDENEKID
jgi:hypothetical protein